MIANAAASGAGAVTGWCHWNITPSAVGPAADTGLDDNDVTIANSNVNISTDFFLSAGAAARWC